MLLAIFICLFSNFSLGMELVPDDGNVEMNIKNNIALMKKGLDIQYKFLALDPEKIDLPLENFRPVGDKAGNLLFLLNPNFPLDIWKKIWMNLNDMSKFKIGHISREFYKTIGQSMLVDLLGKDLKQTLCKYSTDDCKYYTQGTKKNDFGKLLECTQKLDTFSQNADEENVREVAIAAILGYRNEAGKLLKTFESGNDQLQSPTETYEQYSYLSEIYQYDYIKITCCDRVGFCCTDTAAIFQSTCQPCIKCYFGCFNLGESCCNKSCCECCSSCCCKIDKGDICPACCVVPYLGVKTIVFGLMCSICWPCYCCYYFYARPKNTR